MPANKPLSVSSGYLDYPNIVLDGKGLPRPTPVKAANYWFVVLDRSTLDVVYNIQQASNTDVPSGLTQYDDTSHILIVATLSLYNTAVPQGDLFTFLVDHGGGSTLRRLEQIGVQLTCTEVQYLAYSLVSVLGTDDLGFETMAMSGNVTVWYDAGQSEYYGRTTGPGAILTLLLMPVDVDGTTMWTPITLPE